MEADIFNSIEEVEENRLCKVSDEIYFGHPYFSRSHIKKAYRKPHKLFSDENKETKAMRLGRAFHSFMLEPDLFYENYHILHSDYNGKWESTIDKHVKEGILPPGKSFIREKDAKWMSAAKLEAMKCKIAAPLLNLSNKFVECSLFTKFFEEKVDVKVKLDMIDLNARTIYDLKSIKDISLWESESRNRDYDLQAYFYTEVAKIVFGFSFDFIIIFMEKSEDSPGIKVVQASGDAMGRGRNKMQKGLENIERALQCREEGYSYSQSDQLEVF